MKIVLHEGMKMVRWTLLHKTNRKTNCGARYWLCQCDCGTTKEVSNGSLLAGSNSCGCFASEITTNKNFIHGESKGTKTNGLTREYVCWMSMRSRCNNPNNPDYPDYGGRGIVICEEWDLYENFLMDMGRKPHGMTIDRKNNNGNYEPSNCQWATNLQQNINRRMTKRFIQGTDNDD